jgi:predicted HTH domain antitoxin
MTITIPDGALLAAKLSPNDLLIDFAVYLYEKKIVSIGQAKKIANIDLITFQKELAKKNICIHYEISDLEKDLENLKDL